MKTRYDLEEKCEDHIGSIYHCVKILTSEDVGSGGTNVRSSDAYFFLHSHYPRCTIREDPAGEISEDEDRSRNHRNYASVSDVPDFRSDPTSSHGEVEMTLLRQAKLPQTTTTISSC